MKKLILHNKIIYELFTRLKSITGHHAGQKILIKTINELYNRMPFISPIYLIETAIFNSIIPVKFSPTLVRNKYITGQSLKKSIICTIINLFKFIKKIHHESFSIKLTLIFIKLYNKEHLLYEQKFFYLNKILII